MMPLSAFASYPLQQLQRFNRPADYLQPDPGHEKTQPKTGDQRCEQVQRIAVQAFRQAGHHGGREGYQEHAARDDRIALVSFLADL